MTTPERDTSWEIAALAEINETVEHLCVSTAWWADRDSAEVADRQGYRSGARGSADRAIASIDRAVELLRDVRAKVHAERTAFDDHELRSQALGNGAAHDWDTSHPGLTPCRRCQVKATVQAIRKGLVPPCSPEQRCPASHSLGVHEICGAGRDTASCMFCGTTYGPPGGDGQ